MSINKKKYLFYHILFSLLFISCYTQKVVLKPDCRLDKKTNTILGDEHEAKEFYIKKLFIPAAVENLLDNRKTPLINYNHFFENTTTNERFTGYHIQGCRDTTWAKLTMANHLLDKYNIIRYDSTYYVTIYTIKVNNESKIIRRNEKCNSEWHYFINKNDVIVNQYNCVSWGMVLSFLMPIGMNDKCNRIVGEDRQGYYDITVPSLIYRDKGLDAYKQYLHDSVGIDMNFERIDTLIKSVYKYRKY